MDSAIPAVLPLEGGSKVSSHHKPSSVSNLNEEAHKYPDYHVQPRSSSPQRGRLLGIPEYHAPRLNIAGRSYSYEEKYPPDAPLAEADEDVRVWKVYLDEADVFDHDMIRGFRDTTDSLLVFVSIMISNILHNEAQQCRRRSSLLLDKAGSESPELSLGSFWIEEEKALEDALNIFDAVSWLHSISTNPSVQLIAAVSLASLISGPTTH
ncbi:hypothetical protein DL96DRAFT_1803335 [Flagelloscypha sp. PMI_526]|nr:hypothetical protein DL96DRAFT_1803335 [Flagelloscypha sp. PMI_526]